MLGVAFISAPNLPGSGWLLVCFLLDFNQSSYGRFLLVLNDEGSLVGFLIGFALTRSDSCCGGTLGMLDKEGALAGSLIGIALA